MMMLMEVISQAVRALDVAESTSSRGDCISCMLLLVLFDHGLVLDGELVGAITRLGSSCRVARARRVTVHVSSAAWYDFGHRKLDRVHG